MPSASITFCAGHHLPRLDRLIHGPGPHQRHCLLIEVSAPDRAVQLIAATCPPGDRIQVSTPPGRIGPCADQRSVSVTGSASWTLMIDRGGFRTAPQLLRRLVLFLVLRVQRLDHHIPTT